MIRFLLESIPSWFLLAFAIADGLIIVSIIYRWGHVVFSRYDIALLAIAVVFGPGHIDFTATFGNLDMTELLSMSRGMRFIQLFTIAFICHRAIIRQKKLGRVIEQWE